MAAISKSIWLDLAHLLASVTNPSTPKHYLSLNTRPALWVFDQNTNIPLSAKWRTEHTHSHSKKMKQSINTYPCVAFQVSYNRAKKSHKQTWRRFKRQPYAKIQYYTTNKTPKETLMSLCPFIQSGALSALSIRTDVSHCNKQKILIAYSYMCHFQIWSIGPWTQKIQHELFSSLTRSQPLFLPTIFTFIFHVSHTQQSL